MDFDPMAMAQQLRAQRQQEQMQRQQSAQQSMARSDGGVIGQSSPASLSTQAPQQQQDPMSSSLQTGINAYDKARTMGKMLGGSSGSFAGASPATMSAMGSGGGSSLGSMGLMSSAPAVSYPGAASVGGSTVGAGAGAGGAMGAAGGVAGLAALGHIVDKEMNENKGSMINADKINKMGSVNGIGLRFGDLANGFNPATWMSDPKKAAKGLGNFFTLGFLDKL